MEAHEYTSDIPASCKTVASHACLCYALLIWHKTLESVCQIVSALAVLLPWRENFCFTAISLLCILSCATTLAEIILSERLGIVLDKAGEETTWSLGWVVV